MRLNVKRGLRVSVSLFRRLTDASVPFDLNMLEIWGQSEPFDLSALDRSRAVGDQREPVPPSRSACIPSNAPGKHRVIALCRAVILTVNRSGPRPPAPGRRPVTRMVSSRSTRIALG